MFNVTVPFYSVDVESFDYMSKHVSQFTHLWRQLLLLKSVGENRLSSPAMCMCKCVYVFKSTSFDVGGAVLCCSCLSPSVCNRVRVCVQGQESSYLQREFFRIPDPLR